MGWEAPAVIRLKPERVSAIVSTWMVRPGRRMTSRKLKPENANSRIPIPAATAPMSTTRCSSVVMRSRVPSSSTASRTTPSSARCRKTTRSMLSRSPAVRSRSIPVAYDAVAAIVKTSSTQRTGCSSSAWLRFNIRDAAQIASAPSATSVAGLPTDFSGPTST